MTECRVTRYLVREAINYTLHISDETGLLFKQLEPITFVPSHQLLEQC